MLYVPQSPLEAKTVHRGRSNRYHCQVEGGPWVALSLRCVFNGEAQYLIEGARYAVDDTCYLIFDSKPYEMAIDSNTEVETFCIRIPESWKRDALRSLVTAAGDAPLVFDSEAVGESPVALVENIAADNDDLL